MESFRLESQCIWMLLFDHFISYHMRVDFPVEFIALFRNWMFSMNLNAIIKMPFNCQINNVSIHQKWWYGIFQPDFICSTSKFRRNISKSSKTKKAILANVLEGEKTCFLLFCCENQHHHHSYKIKPNKENRSGKMCIETQAYKIQTKWLAKPP